MSLRPIALLCALAFLLGAANLTRAAEETVNSKTKTVDARTSEDLEKAPAALSFSRVKLNRPVPATRAYVAPDVAPEADESPFRPAPVENDSKKGEEMEFLGRVLVDQRLDDGSGRCMIEDELGMLRTVPQDAILSIEDEEERSVDDLYDDVEKKLLEEFGDGFSARRSGRFFFVSNASPAYVDWCARLFAALETGFEKFAEKHDIKLKDRPEPLVVVVFATRDAFVRYAAVETPSANTLAAYYNMQTNRVALYDLTLTETGASAADPRRKRLTLAETREILSRPNAAFNVATVVHEATHQIAFNRGLFLRTGPMELWTVEGLSLVFETPSGRVAQNGWSYKSSFPTNARMKNLYLSRVNPNVAKNANPFRKIVEQDGFYQNIEASYASSWALFYYLYKKKPRQLVQYLELLAEKYPCALYTKEDRLEDFESIFGKDWDKLARDVDKFVRKN